jgi:serine/threonine protein kinase
MAGVGQFRHGLSINDWLLTELRASPGPYQVWMARNLLTRQTADLKVYDPERMPNTMILREVDILSQMRTPQFPCLLGHFPWEGCYIVATKFVDGCTLEELLVNNRSGLPFEMAMDAARSFLTGLEQLHQLPGIPVHRALSPSQILLDTGMNLFISGLAFAEPSENLSMSETLSYRFEDPRYCAPEVFADPAAASPRSNVYSAACILFEAFTGRRAFDSDERTADAWYSDLAYQHQNVPPPMFSNHAPQLPEHIGSAFDMALCKDPDVRPVSCAEFAVMLDGSQPPEVEVQEEFIPQESQKRGFWNWFRAKDSVS